MALLLTLQCFSFHRVLPALPSLSTSPLKPNPPGGILVLDGCCYIAHMPHLQRRLALCVRNPDGYADGAEGTAGGGAAGAGASADGGETGAQEGMPFIVSFGGAVPALAGPVYFQVRHGSNGSMCGPHAMRSRPAVCGRSTCGRHARPRSSNRAPAPRPRRRSSPCGSGR